MQGAGLLVDARVDGEKLRRRPGQVDLDQVIRRIALGWDGAADPIAVINHQADAIEAFARQLELHRAMPFLVFEQAGPGVAGIACHPDFDLANAGRPLLFNLIFQADLGRVEQLMEGPARGGLRRGRRTGRHRGARWGLGDGCTAGLGTRRGHRRMRYLRRRRRQAARQVDGVAGRRRRGHVDHWPRGLGRGLGQGPRSNQMRKIRRRQHGHRHGGFFRVAAQGSSRRRQTVRSGQRARRGHAEGARQAHGFARRVTGPVGHSCPEGGFRHGRSRNAEDHRVVRQRLQDLPALVRHLELDFELVRVGIGVVDLKRHQHSFRTRRQGLHRDVRGHRIDDDGHDRRQVTRVGGTKFARSVDGGRGKPVLAVLGRLEVEALLRRQYRLPADPGLARGALHVKQDLADGRAIPLIQLDGKDEVFLLRVQLAGHCPRPLSVHAAAENRQARQQRAEKKPTIDLHDPYPLMLLSGGWSVVSGTRFPAASLFLTPHSSPATTHHRPLPTVIRSGSWRARPGNPMTVLPSAPWARP